MTVAGTLAARPWAWGWVLDSVPWQGWLLVGSSPLEPPPPPGRGMGVGRVLGRQRNVAAALQQGPGPEARRLPLAVARGAG